MKTTSQTHVTIEPSFGHGGNIHHLSRKMKDANRRILDFSANINPLGPPSWLRRVISSEIENLVHYPDPDCFEFVEAISQHFNVPSSQVIPANGTTELLYLLPQILTCKRAIVPVPSYVDYVKVMKMQGIEVETLVLLEENDFSLDVQELVSRLRGDEIVIIGSPNNPTGVSVDPDKILDVARDFPDTIIVIDEAFLDFSNGAGLSGKSNNIITLNSLTKFYALPGLRLGFGVFPEKMAAKLRAILPPWTVNTLAQKVGSLLFKDTEYAEKSRVACKEYRDGLVQELSSLTNLKIYPGDANYLLIRLVDSCPAQELYEKMLKKGFAVRVCDNYQGLDGTYFRIAVRTPEENKLFASALTAVLYPKTVITTAERKKARSLMFQGTSSNAGKSILTAALCRILLQDGVRVAPFKAQNMSLNSFVTLDGKEMGRAQVVQAQAARLDPDVRMNPVLLKPNSDTGSQIIVHGKPIGNMSAIEYYDYKMQVSGAAHSSYDELADEFEVIVLEGAGSPGEVNLKKNDIVNMNMARYAKSPVLLVGDIDRGGVYASFVGTMEVLDQWERNLLAGFIVNRFRGQASLLDDAHHYVKAHTKKEVLGVVPYLRDLGIPEEDSVSFKEGIFHRPPPTLEYVDIVLIGLPHISNFTDIEPFIEEPDVHLRIVTNPGDIGHPDAIILPGSKNVIGDLQFLHSNAMAEVISREAESGCEIVGICGGYQILGKKVRDPYCIESSGVEVNGLGLLDMETVLEESKQLIRKDGKHKKSQLSVHGYEIHHGISSGSLEPVLIFDDGSFCGARNRTGHIWGSYLHGIFDDDIFRRWFINSLRQRKGLQPEDKILAPYDLEPAFDRLAKTVRESVDMDTIYSLLKL